tara:strand:+ start:7570 stop:8436 length:867 start_codon:yes stop_codon:yes gene_type:complete
MGQALCRIAPAWLRLAAAGLTAAAFPAAADEPCPGTEDGLDACRAYIEINATDGDIGFHAKLDAEGWRWAKIYSPRGRPLMLTGGLGPLRRQTVTEFFFESEEPPCWFEAGNDDVDWDEDEVVSLRHFLERFPEGEYHFRVKQPRGGMLAGSTIMSHALPGAPRDLAFEDNVISWAPGDDLGRCEPEGGSGAGMVPVVAYQVVLEPDVDAEEPADELAAAQIFDVLVPGNVTSVSVPEDYVATFPENTPAKVEIIAIEQRDNGSFGNQVAAEEDGFCLNETGDGCEED